MVTLAHKKNLLLNVFCLTLIVNSTVTLFLPMLHVLAYEQAYRPYNLRVLVPWTSQLLELLTGIGMNTWLQILTVLFSILLYLALKELFKLSGRSELSSGLLSLLWFHVLYGMMFIYGKFYDIPTAFFFTYALVLLWKRQLLNYALLFPLATLNRETSILLVLVTGYWLLSWTIRHKLISVRYLAITLYQILVYIPIRLWIAHLYRDTPGDTILWMLPRNWSGYMDDPLETILFFLGVLLVIFVCYSGRDLQDGLLTSAFYTLFPVQVILWQLLGLQWELRVFMESLPVLAILFTSGIERYFHSVREFLYERQIIV